MEAPANGVLFQIVVPEGMTVSVGTILALIAEPRERPGRIEGIQLGEVVEAEPKLAEAPEVSLPEKPPEKELVLATPAACRLAKELNVELALVQGSGSGGRVTERDVIKYHKEGPPPAKITPLAQEMSKHAGLLHVSMITGTGEARKITKEDVEPAMEMIKLEEETEPVKRIPFTGMRKTIADNIYASLRNTAQLTVSSEVDVTEMVRF